MLKNRAIAVMLLGVAVLIGYFVYKTEMTPNSRLAFKQGLDLKGGTHLVYKADTSKVSQNEIAGAMTSLQDVIERRINVLGVSEPLVQIEDGGVLQTTEHRLIVELPGVTDVEEAKATIGKTPILEFKLLRNFPTTTTQEELQKKTADELFIDTGLTGRYLDHAALEFDQTTSEPRVALSFNKEGTALFGQITKGNVGRVLAIFLDGKALSSPTIRDEIKDGKAIISGSFNAQSARLLVRDLNYGALPLPIELISTQSIGASLGEKAVAASMKAGWIAFLVIAGFLIFWYRFPGFLAVVALGVYTVLNLALFKLIPVTLTAAGIAGFILSIGMAVDANILIFERMKEELKRGHTLKDAIHEGFARAWLSIRDSNISSILTALILYFFASTPIVKGFALVFFIGVCVSMFTAITASRMLLRAFNWEGSGKITHFLFGSGFSK